MADRFPLIFNTNADQIQELAASDNLDLASSNLTNVANIDVAGLSTFSGAASLGVTTVSSDRKEGLKMFISKDAVQLSVNNPNSGEGVEKINAKFNSDDLNISFNSRYLTDIASQIENESIIIYLKDPGSPVLIMDLLDKNSFHVVMPMKI